MAAEGSRRFTIGYALAPKKQSSFIQPSLLRLAAARGVDLVPVRPDADLLDQGPFECVLHKLSGDRWRAQLAAFARRFPGVPIVDDLAAIDRLRSRISMLQVVSELRVPQDRETFGVPRQVVVHDRLALADPGGLLGGLRFPVIAKPLVSDGSARSHKMTLVFAGEALLRLKPPVVLQEFVNHGGVVFKVYVAGDHVRCVKRKSLPDVAEDRREWSESSVSFSQVSNVAAAPGKTEEYYRTMHLEDAEMPPGLHLFNFDVIRDVKVGNHYLVIDINYFPGYAKMPSYETVLTDFFWDVLQANNKINPSAAAEVVLLAENDGKDAEVAADNVG